MSITNKIHSKPIYHLRILFEKQGVALERALVFFEKKNPGASKISKLIYLEEVCLVTA